MEEHLHEVSAEWRQRAYIDQAKYKDYVPPRSTTPTPSGASTASGSTGSSRHQGQEHELRPGQRLDQMVRGRPLNVAVNCLDRHLAKRGDQTAIIWEGDDPEDRRQDHLSRAARRGLPLRQRPEGARRQEGRPRHDLHADDPGSGLRDARLRAHRRDPFGRVRRLLAGFARRPHRGLRVATSSSPPTKACAAAARSRSRPTSTRRSRKAPRRRAR